MITQQDTAQQENKLLFRVDVNTLLDITKTLKELLTEVRIKINKEGLRITEIDVSNVCMVNIVVNDYKFIELTTETEIKEYGVNVEDLYKLLKENKKKLVKITTDNNKLYLEFSNGINSEMSLINIETEKKNVPELDFKTEIEINSKRLKEILKHFYSNSESVVFETENEFFKIYSKNNNIKIDNNEVRIKGNNNKSGYSTEYLSKFIKVIFSDKTILKFSEDYPLMFEQTTDNLKVSYILAPRVGSED